MITVIALATCMFACNDRSESTAGSCSNLCGWWFWLACCCMYYYSCTVTTANHQLPDPFIYLFHFSSHSHLSASQPCRGYVQVRRCCTGQLTASRATATVLLFQRGLLHAVVHVDWTVVTIVRYVCTAYCTADSLHVRECRSAYHL